MWSQPSTAVVVLAVLSAFVSVVFVVEVLVVVFVAFGRSCGNLLPVVVSVAVEIAVVGHRLMICRR